MWLRRSFSTAARAVTAAPRYAPKASDALVYEAKTPPAYLSLDAAHLPETRAKGLADEWERTQSTAVMWRKQYLERILAKAKEVGAVVVISGTRGTGKSVACASVVHELRREGRNVIYVPSIHAYTHRSVQCCPNPFDLGRYDLPAVGQEFLRDLLESNAELLGATPLPAELAGRYRRDNCPAALVEAVRAMLRELPEEERREATKLATLRDLAELGGRLREVAGQAMVDVLAVLRRGPAPEGGKPLTIVLDEYNSFYLGTAYTFIEQQERLVDMWDMLEPVDPAKAVEGEGECWLGHDRAGDDGFETVASNWMDFVAKETERRREEERKNQGRIGGAKEDADSQLVTGQRNGVPEVFGRAWSKAILRLGVEDIPQLAALHVLDPAVGGKRHAREAGVSYVLATTERLPYPLGWEGAEGAAWIARRAFIPRFPGYPGRPALRPHERPTKKQRRADLRSPRNELDPLDVHPLDPVSLEVVVDGYDADEVFGAAAHYLETGVLQEDVSYPEIKILEMSSQRNPRLFREGTITLHKEEYDLETKELLNLPY